MEKQAEANQGYLRTAAIAKAVLGGIIFTYSGVAVLAIGVIGTVLEVKKDGGAVWVGIFFLAVGLGLLVRGGLRLLEIRLARKCSQAFVFSRAAFVPLADAAKTMGVSESIAKRILTRLLGKQYFSGCMMQSSPAGIILEDKINPFAREALNAEGSGFHEGVTVTCPNCGATTVLTFGKYGTCQYCGSAIQIE